MKKIHVGLIYGGLSSEHEVSIASARNVFAALDPERYEVTPIRIDRAGRWLVGDATLAEAGDAIPEASAERAEGRQGEGLADVQALGLDVAFPMLHGQNGEDGRIQGLLMALGLPFVGAGVLSSAICMDKEVTKRLLRDAGLPIVPFRVARRGEQPPYEDVTAALGTPLFVKPANSGSSVGTSKVEDAGQYAKALAGAFDYDNKVLIEQAIKGREIECAVLGNEEPKVAVPGEIVSTAQFYTYEAKYKDATASRMEVPANLPEALAEGLRHMAADAYVALGCEGMARVDFFVVNEEEVYINEINTIPGFTKRSMYPVMWEETGLSIGQLVDTLIQLALDRHARDARLKTTH